MLNLQTDFHAIGDGIADDSSAVQAAFTYFSSHNGELYCPQGTYRLTRTVQYTGNVSGGIHIVGDIGGTRGPNGTLFLYDGPVMQNAVFYLLGMNGSTIENIEVNCQSKALYGIWLDATSSASSSGNVLRRVTVNVPAGTDCAAVAFGHPSAQTIQVSEVAMHDLVLLGSGVGAGIKTYSAGNVKNFLIVGGTISTFAYGIDWQNASGTMTVRSTICGNMITSDFRLGTGALVLEGVESEDNGARFVTGTTGNNPGSLVCKGCSWQGAAPSDDIIINYSGSVVLEGSQFSNTRTGTSYPKIALGGEPRIGQPLASPCSIYSVGNWYRNHPGGMPPFYDGSGNALLDPLGYYGGQDVQVVTLGDYGGLGGALTRITNHVPRQATT